MNKDDLYHVMENSILPSLGKTMKALDIFFGENLEYSNIHITKPQLILLKVLAQHEQIVQNDLAFLTNRDKASLTRIIETMEKKELITRSTSTNDKRVKLVQITDLGIQKMKQAIPIVKKIIQEVEKGIEPKELEITKKVLKKISNNINADNLTAHLKHA